MAGSQLKQLKASLKAAGLTGQTNVKRKGKKNSRKAPTDTRRDDRQEVLDQIRQDFNPFEVKVNRKKRDFEISQGQNSVLKKPVGKPGTSKQIGENQRRAAYELTKSQKNKSGGVIDRRFGENDASLDPEEKMLERFTRERQMQSKRSMFDLEDEDFGEDTLTHYGKSLSAVDGDFQEGDLGVDDADEEPARKKTKAEVMKEVIAKSKFYKNERQMEQERREAKIMDLDDDFDDVFSELQATQTSHQSGGKSQNDLNYEKRMRELAFDRRAAPADRTKTEEEIENEREEKRKAAESQRLNRMEGILEEETQGPDDLDEEFWAEGSENEQDGFTIRDSDAESEVEAEVELEVEKEQQPIETKPKHAANGPNVISIGGKVLSTSKQPSSSISSCPQTHTEFMSLVKDAPLKNHPAIVKDILKNYQPKLAQGNRQKLSTFASVVLDHILYLADEPSSDKALLGSVQNQLTRQLKELAEKYNETLCEAFRAKILSIQKEINAKERYPKPSHLVFYTLVGILYSTSDLYHLVVTPTLLLIGETLETIDPYDDFEKLSSGVYLIDLYLQYQRFSKRYMPEAAFFLEKSFLALIPDLKSLNKTKLATCDSVSFSSKFALNPRDKLSRVGKLALSDLASDSLETKSALLFKLVDLVDRFSGVWNEKSAFVEVATPFIEIFRHLAKFYASEPEITGTLTKLVNVYAIAENDRTPLKLQEHKPISLATVTPKFEENFNPEKKSYDPDSQRQEINKLKALQKKERKLTMREIRKDTKFMARESAKEKKSYYDDYHRKIARMTNLISTTEGAEKNQYEQEKRRSRK